MSASVHCRWAAATTSGAVCPTFSTEMPVARPLAACHNAQSANGSVPFPYIDVVNEVLEAVVAPGATDTALLTDMWRTPAYVESLPVRRLSTPQEIALIARGLRAR